MVETAAEEANNIVTVGAGETKQTWLGYDVGTSTKKTTSAEGDSPP